MGMALTKKKSICIKIVCDSNVNLTENNAKFGMANDRHAQ